MTEILERIPGYLYAMAGEKRVESQAISLAYHGTSYVSPDEARNFKGLPRRGDVLDLLLHAEPRDDIDKRQSAFRGTVPFPAFPLNPNHSAAEWAGDDGWVYEIGDFRGYDLNSIFEGRIPDCKGGFRALTMRELETTIPARVPSIFVKKVGQVYKGRNGLLVEWKSDWTCL